MQRCYLINNVKMIMTVNTIKIERSIWIQWLKMNRYNVTWMEKKNYQCIFVTLPDRNGEFFVNNCQNAVKNDVGQKWSSRYCAANSVVRAFWCFVYIRPPSERISGPKCNVFHARCANLSMTPFACSRGFFNSHLCLKILVQ